MVATVKCDTITNAANTGAANLSLDASGNVVIGSGLTVTGTTTMTGGTASAKFIGSTSGTITLQATAIAGTNTLTLPAVTGTLITSSAPAITNPTITDYIETYYNIGTVTTTASPTLSNGTVQTLTLTASTTCTVTMPTATAGKSFLLLVRQAASTGNGAITWSTVKWGTAGTPTVTATAGKMDIFTFVADGTNWYGSAAQGYTP
jgi:hypothetical protein